MQPVSGYNFKHITGTATGTTNLIVDRAGELHSVIIPANKTGTASFYNAGTAAGTASTSLIADVPNTVGSIPTTVPFNVECQDGLIVVVGGTVDFTVVYK